MGAVHDPGRALGDGPGGPVPLLLLRCLRTATLVLITAGIGVAVLAGRDDDLSTIGTPSGLLRSLVTPLAVLAAGIVLRLLLTPLAYLSALAVVLGAGADVVPDDDRRATPTRWSDRLRVANAYRSLRWTSAVKDRAVTEAGGAGRALRVAEDVLRVLIGVAAALTLVAIALG